MICTCILVSVGTISIQGNLFACKELLPFAKSKTAQYREPQSSKSLNNIVFSTLFVNGEELPTHLQNDYYRYCFLRHKRKMKATFFVIESLQQPHSVICNSLLKDEKYDIMGNVVLRFEFQLDKSLCNRSSSYPG